MNRHCKRLSDDRTQGELWERKFCNMISRRYGFILTPHQQYCNGSAVYMSINDKQWEKKPLPDVTIWTCPPSHHEIKHKNPTTSGKYGLEVYRYESLRNFALENGFPVYYTIHNHDLSGGREITKNNIDHWETVDIRNLKGREILSSTNSYVNGVAKIVEIYFWPKSLWFPLKNLYE